MLVEANRREKFNMRELNPILLALAEEIKTMGYKGEPVSILQKSTF